MDYAMGYKPINHKRVSGVSVLSKIKYSKLRVVGGGGSGVVVTDGKYAIKIGQITNFDYEMLTQAAAHGWAMPVLYFERGVQIDERIKCVIFDDRERERIGSAGYTADPEGFFYDNGTTDIMVSLYAESYLPPQVALEGSERTREWKFAQKVREVLKEQTGMHWPDAHPWNLGVYRGGIIIFDF